MKNTNETINMQDSINKIESASFDKAGKLIEELAIAIVEHKPKIINNSTELSDFINQLGFTVDGYKTDLAIAIIEQKPKILGNNEEEKGGGLSEIITAFGIYFHYDTLLVCDLLERLPQTVVIDFKTLNNNLYPNNYLLKKELILEAIERGVIHKNNFLNCGFDEIKTDDIYLKILEKAKAKNIITDLELLNHNKDKLSSKFTSIKELFDINLEENKLEENKLNDIFANEGNPLNTIALWFASPDNQFNINQYKLSDIIEYCRASGKLTELNSLFKEEFEKEIKKLYIPSSQKVITDVDIKQIAELTSFSTDEVAKKHISIGEMVSHLTPLFTDIKKATLNDIDQIKNDEIKTILTKLLNNESIENEDVKIFYKEITGRDIKDGDIDKLKGFISGNKDILTYIFKKDDGLARLVNVMQSIGDGCGANIANNLNNMALSFLLEDKSKNQNNEIGEKNKNIALKLIYESLMGGILQQALGDGDHLGSNSNASIIKSYNKDSASHILNKRFTSPDYLIEAIAKISNSDKHSTIAKTEIKDIAKTEIEDLFCDADSELLKYLEDDSTKNFKKIIAIGAINLLIKNGENENKITNNNSATYTDTSTAINKAIAIGKEAEKIQQPKGGGDLPSKEVESPENKIKTTVISQLGEASSNSKEINL